MFSLKDTFPYTPMKEQTEDNDDHEFDTLSLSDLPIYSHTSSDFSNSNSSSIYDQPNNESFEFLTTDFRPQTHPDIVFCGKPIPCMETQTYQDDRHYTMKSSHKRCVRYFFGRDKTNKVTENHANGSGKITNNTTSKYKWCFLVFGLQRFSMPTKVELADMKCRQSKRSAKSAEMLERNSSTDSSKSSTKLDKSLSYLLRSLSCNSNHSLGVLD